MTKPMGLFRRLAIALCRLLFGRFLSVRRPQRSRRRAVSRAFPEAYDAYRYDAYQYDTYQYDAYGSYQEYAQENFNEPLLHYSQPTYLTVQPNFLQSNYYSPAYVPYLPYSGCYSSPFPIYQSDEYEDYESYQDDQWYENNQDYEESYETDEEAYLDANYGTVEYRLEVFGGDAFIEFSYEGALDEQEIISALNLLWASSPNRHNQILSGTLRLPLSSHQPVAYLPSSR